VTTPTQLPSKFENLQHFADRFAISDDEQRSDATDSATTAEKRALVEAVAPRLEEIDTWLDTHDDEQDHLLGRLAEATCEVALEVGWPPEK
jgi:hypothetical protein